MDPTQKPQLSFCELPREIRDIVYQHAVVNREPVELHTNLQEDETKIFRLCKQMHEEATEVFYMDNIFFIPTQLFTSEEPLDQILAGPLYRLRSQRLSMVTKLDVDIPVSSLPGKVDARRVLGRLNAFVRMIAAVATPKLQLRFFCQDPLIHDSPIAMDIFADRSAMELELGAVPQAALDGAITNNPAVLQLLRLALRKIRRLCGTVEMHVIVLVHPVFLRKAKRTLDNLIHPGFNVAELRYLVFALIADSMTLDQILHEFPTYLLIGDLDPASTHNSHAMPAFLDAGGAPQASIFTVQTFVDGNFYECLPKCLEPDNAWMWRSYRGQTWAGDRVLQACKETAKLENGVGTDARVSMA